MKKDYNYYKAILKNGGTIDGAFVGIEYHGDADYVMETTNAGGLAVKKPATGEKIIFSINNGVLTGVTYTH